MKSQKLESKDFGGPWGTLAISLFTPLCVFWLWGEAAKSSDLVEIWDLVPSVEKLQASVLLTKPTAYGVLVYVAWFLLQLALAVALPGKVVEGMPLAEGGRLKYRLNGWHAFCATYLLAGGLHVTDVLPLQTLFEHSGSLLSSALVLAVLLAMWLYLRAYAKGVCHLSVAQDFWMGAELNPRSKLFGIQRFEVDWKFFCEGRPGLILWSLLNFSALLWHMDHYGAENLVPLLTISLLQGFYVAVYFYYESNVLSMMDIITEKFGFMLTFGDLCWVPFMYTLQSHLLARTATELQPSVWYSVAGVISFVLGWRIFNGANSQKHEFRWGAGEKAKIWGEPAKFLQTKRGTKLLLSGYWGIARHMNYTGDILMALGMSLPAGPCLLAYFYPIYFTMLLLHREARDNEHCREKYGKDWDKYCELVPYRMIPYVY
ncbi:MAG: hypothetical protein MHM6MM_007891 [Cercozoa sp. M6MM]